MLLPAQRAGLDICLKNDRGRIPGRRIGFGGGYYDKLFLELPDKSLRIGVAYDFQRAGSLYQDPWDKKVEKVITEKNMLCG